VLFHFFGRKRASFAAPAKNVCKEPRFGNDRISVWKEESGPGPDVFINGGKTMTIDEAVREIQGKSAGITGRASVSYAREQMEEGEKIFAAASANIQSRHGNFPGVIVFTDRRLLAAGALPGIRRAISLPLTKLKTCKSRKSPLSYTVSLKTGTDGFSAVLSPRAGESFAPYISALERAVSGRYK
jgi:hypothetical protein